MRRRAYTLVLAIVGMGLVVLFAFLLARYAMLEIGRERQASLELCGRGVAASAQAWSLLHADELAGPDAVALPIKSLLPDGATGEAELRRITPPGADPLIECRITLRLGRQTLHRHLVWPLGSAKPLPAEVPATP